MTNCEEETKEIDVVTTTELPYVYVPYGSVAQARALHPCGVLYVYTAKAPKGFQIVAVPVLLHKPEVNQEGVEVEYVEA